MSAQSNKVIAIVLLGALGLPPGLCSLYFTPVGLVSISSHDGLERFVGMVTLVCSAVGWAICGATIWGAVRLTRSPSRKGAPDEPTS